MSHLQALKPQLAGLNLEAQYWDVRIEDSIETSISLLDGEITSATVSPALGAFLRVRKSGFWYYQATTDIEGIREALLELDRNPDRSGTPGELKTERHQPCTSKIPSEKQIFRVPLSEKTNLLQGYDAIIKSSPNVKSWSSGYKDVYKAKCFLNSVGTEYEFDFNQGGMYLSYTLKDGDSLFEDRAMIYGTDFDQLRSRDTEVKDYIAASQAFLHAPAIEPGKYRVLLAPQVAGVFTHESFGHKSEADFMMGNPDALNEWKLGKKIGSDCLSIVDCGTYADSSGHCPIDDEGTPAKKNYLIKNGVLAGRLHSLETALRLDEKPTGNARAMSFEWEPMVRMTSTFIEPGSESYESILNRSAGAILVEGVKHGSGMSTFTIAPLRGYLISEGGQRQPIRVTVLSGSVFATLSNVEAVSSEFLLDSSAIGGCGKMEQWPLPVAYGGPYVLIKEMQVS